MFSSAEMETRAKRYERLMKANGINPNGGPDPKPVPPSTSKAGKSSPKEDSPKPPAKRRKVNNSGEKKHEDVFQSPKPKPEPLAGDKTEETAIPVAGGFPLPPAQQSQYEPVQNDETNFDFNEFCSPEMFAHCASDAGYPSQEKELVSAPGPAPVSAPVSKAQPAAIGNVLQMPQSAREELKAELRPEKKPEIETVVIAD